MFRWVARNWKTLLVLAVVLAAAYLWFNPDLEILGEEDSHPEDIWRCSACAAVGSAGGKSCQSVTKRGSERSTLELLTKRLCAKAQVRNECEVTNVECGKLSSSAP